VSSVDFTAADDATIAALDRDDPLRAVRDQFEIPEGIIYLDGNSLGALARPVAERVGAVLTREWGRDLIGAWVSAGWIDMPRRVGAKVAPLIGAAPDEVVVADSTSVNLFKCILAAADLNRPRSVILTEWPKASSRRPTAASATGRAHRGRWPRASMRTRRPWC